jgi:hypothetical protein
MLLRSPCKNLKPYDNPFWGFEKGIKKKEEKKKNFCTRDPPLGPPSTLAEIFRRTCLQSHLQTSPPTPQKSYPKFPNPRTTFENTPLSPQLFFYWNPNIYVTKESMQKFETLRQPLLGFLTTVPWRKRLIPKIVAT